MCVIIMHLYSVNYCCESYSLMAEPYSVLEHEYIGRRDGQGLSISKLYIECHV